MSHKVFIRHTYIYKCSSCSEEWKINEAESIEKLSCPHCGKHDVVDYVKEDQRTRFVNKWG
jgi:DNA-directed RNA polymerase subunit RPC12/RpoP